VNARGRVVVSGDEAAVAQVAAAFAARGVRTTRLVVSHAFHSARMAPMLDALREVASSIVPREGRRCRVYPTAARRHAFGSGGLPGGADPHGAVRFADAVAARSPQGEHRFVELGSRPVLAPMVARQASETGAEVTLIGAGPSVDDVPASEVLALLRAAGDLWASGEAVSTTTLVPPGDRITLPSMVWEKQRYWINDVGTRTVGDDTGHRLLGVRVPLAGDWSRPTRPPGAS
jgi:acyl transferase domain-containing protein